MRTAIIILLFATIASGGTTIERILPMPTEHVWYLQALNQEPNSAPYIGDYVSLAWRPLHHELHIQHTSFPRFNDPNRHEEYFLAPQWARLKFHIDYERTPGLLFVDTNRQPEYYGDSFVWFFGYRETRVPGRIPELWRQVWIIDQYGNTRLVYFRGCCGNKQIPHNCEYGIEYMLTWAITPEFWWFASWWLRDCEWPGWCGRCDLNFDGAVDLRDLAILQLADLEDLGVLDGEDIEKIKEWLLGE